MQFMLQTLFGLDPLGLFRASERALESSNSTLAAEVLPKLHDLSSQIEDVKKKLAMLAAPANEFVEISPAFQWAQNSTHVLLQVKLTRRWNAPGAVALYSPSFESSKCGLVFTGKGEHSGNFYRYNLDLKFFGEIEESQVKDLSVGKFLITAQKKFPAISWPRLLQVAQTNRLDNMHVWHEMQDKFPKTFISKKESSCSCQAKNEVYCPLEDKCVVDCSLCGKLSKEGQTVCLSPPTELVTSAKFKDTDGRENFIAGELTFNFTELFRVQSPTVRVSIVDSKKAVVEEIEKIEISMQNSTCEHSICSLSLPFSDFQITGDSKFFAIAGVNEQGASEKTFHLRFTDSVAPPAPKIKKITKTHVELDFADKTTRQASVYYGKRGCAKDKQINADVKRGFPSVKLESTPPESATHVLVFGRSGDGNDSVGCSEAELVVGNEEL